MYQKQTVSVGVPLYSEVAMSNAFSLDLEIILFCDYGIVFVIMLLYF